MRRSCHCFAGRSSSVPQQQADAGGVSLPRANPDHGRRWHSGERAHECAGIVSYQSISLSSCFMLPLVTHTVNHTHRFNSEVAAAFPSLSSKWYIWIIIHRHKGLCFLSLITVTLFRACVRLSKRVSCFTSACPPATACPLWRPPCRGSPPTRASERRTARGRST